MVSSSVVPFDLSQDVWRRALARAAARPYEMEYLGSRDFKGTPMDFYRVSSNSVSGDWHAVSVSWFAGRGHSVYCDCHAGQRDVVCVHAALVLHALGILDDPDPDSGALALAA